MPSAMHATRGVKEEIETMRLAAAIVIFLATGSVLSAQSEQDLIAGRISFISSQNIYVRFPSTNGISKGDTLYIPSGGQNIPALVVLGSSSTSCLCRNISSLTLSVSDFVSARKKKIPQDEVVPATAREEQIAVLPQDTASTSQVSEPQKSRKQVVNGSISAYSYSELTNTPAGNSTRFRYNLSLDARNIGDSRFSIVSYVSYNQRLHDTSTLKNDIFKSLKIYDLAVSYEAGSKTRITLGRTINPRIASLGSMDGLQTEVSMNKFSVGALAGFRPDYSDYGFNGKLLQYGAYAAFSTSSQGALSESSLAFMEQMNNGKTDRRFLYFQHTNSLIKNIYLFGSFEVDLYSIDTLNNDKPVSTFDLTGINFYLRYRIGPRFTLTGSYDSRKNIIYYETYRSYLDRMLANEMRQSFRLSADFTITSGVSAGIQSGYRYLKSDPRPAKNVYGYLRYYQIPGVDISATLSGTWLESNYLNGYLAGTDLSKDLINGKLTTGAGYKYVSYDYFENKLKIIQNIAEFSLSWQLAPKFMVSAWYEGTFEKSTGYHRIYLQARKRF